MAILEVTLCIKINTGIAVLIQIGNSFRADSIKLCTRLFCEDIIVVF